MLRGPGQAPGAAPGAGRGDLFCPLVALDVALVAGSPRGPGPQCHHAGRPVCGLGHQRALPGLRHPRGLGRLARHGPRTGRAGTGWPPSSRKPGSRWQRRGTAFKSNPLACTLMACWEPGPADPRALAGPAGPSARGRKPCLFEEPTLVSPSSPCGEGCKLPRFTNEVQHLTLVLPRDATTRSLVLQTGVNWPVYTLRDAQELTRLKPGCWAPCHPLVPDHHLRQWHRVRVPPPPSRRDRNLLL